jgi:phosphate transport system permease protein
MNPIYSRRRRVDILIRGLCFAAALFGVTWLALFTLLYNGAGLQLLISADQVFSISLTTLSGIEM